ncbi:hypothetical protein [Amycolatopsis sp. cmx-8-4]|uniref:hypothetical protein n=1 Tax=Amycolatopsis sp. cmx-8-4 TaxID=2790947 RepID=UPI00397DC39D
MKIDDLLRYEETERDYVRTHGHRAVFDGFVSDATKIYADRLVPDRLGFHRAGAPLSALLLLYEQTVVYVPPTSKEVVQQRLGMKWDQFLALVERGCVQPIIGHPSHYARKAHINDLFSFKPPSVWARGDELARRFANADEHWEVAQRVLPLEEMVREAWVHAKYKKHFPHLTEKNLRERIATEICTNYVDLCIYGYEPIATGLATLPDRAWSVRRLLEASELLTYPTLMGLGGTPNYGISAPVAVAEAAGSEYLCLPEIRQFGPEVQLLLEGLALQVPTTMDVDTLVQFHQDGMARHLWSALQNLEYRVATAQATELDELVDSAVVAEQIIQSTLQDVRGVTFGSLRSAARRRVHPWTDLTVKLGSTLGVTAAAHGPLGLDWLNAALAGAQFAGLMFAFKGYDRLTAAAEKRLVEHLMRRKTSSLAVQLWWLSNWQHRQLAD